MEEREKPRGYKTYITHKNILVSTIFRQCSAALYDGWYYETMVWSLTTDNKLDKLIGQFEGGLWKHIELVERIDTNLPLEDSDA